jgi:hypothetical protein
MTRKITCSFTLTEEIIDYIEAHAGVEGRSALVRQMLVDYIHSTEIRQYRHAESGLEVMAFRCMSHDHPHLQFGCWTFYDGEEVLGVLTDEEFKAQYMEVEDE